MHWNFESIRSTDLTDVQEDRSDHEVSQGQVSFLDYHPEHPKRGGGWGVSILCETKHHRCFPKPNHTVFCA